MDREAPIQMTGMLVGNLNQSPKGPIWVGPMLKLTPKRDNNKTGVTAFFVNFFMHSPRQYLNGQIIIVTLRPKHPK